MPLRKRRDRCRTQIAENGQPFGALTDRDIAIRTARRIQPARQPAKERERARTPPRPFPNRSQASNDHSSQKR